ncbi:dephospho-CoA kinase [Blastopirellula sp. JC732]|uniref:Dephospho-CoA kinase n=1 Tax=Blastopirellula sediminis TaxID=2894196 RepID=A0A9X1MSX8_9BACT|nr:dephospho-CoA kinase [Blastopirellula sediminis]MCC9605193.1 dephospho-CoA kinase [Blastopirellula sediminis]MCC9631507.1 dephospho-CoA kinase [Blastopirellula sediminis]
MKVIGILGGIASGKSTVAGLFRQRGAVVADADQMGHEVLRDEATKREIREIFGSEVFQDNGEVDRRRLAAKVFGGDDLSHKRLAELEKITHPRIKTRLHALIRSTQSDPSGAPPALIMDAALLVKAGWSDICDNLVFIDTPYPERLKYAAQRGWSEAEFNAREAAQEKLEDKRVLSDYIIRNDGDLEQLDAQVEQYWRDCVLSPTT